MRKKEIPWTQMDVSVVFQGKPIEGGIVSEGTLAACDILYNDYRTLCNEIDRREFMHLPKMMGIGYIIRKHYNTFHKFLYNFKLYFLSLYFLKIKTGWHYIASIGFVKNPIISSPALTDDGVNISIKHDGFYYIDSKLKKHIGELNHPDSETIIPDFKKQIDG